MGTTDNIQVKIEAQMTEFFFNQTEHGFAETRQSALKFAKKCNFEKSHCLPQILKSKR